MSQADLYGKAFCTVCGTTVEGHLTGIKVCPKCGGTMTLIKRMQT